MDMLKPRKETTGRKKIEIKKLENNANKLTAFSKRRPGLFKKASELCILCNVHAALIVFSPAGKLYLFGEPDAETLINRYLGGTAAVEVTNARGMKSVSYEEHDKEYDEALKKLESEKEKLKEIDVFASVCERADWWNEPIDEMSAAQLKKFMVATCELRRKLAERADQLMMMLPMF